MSCSFDEKKIFKPLRSYLNLSKLIPTYPNRSEPIPTNMNLSQHIPTSPNIFEPIWTYPNKYEPIPAFPILSKLIWTYPSQLEHIWTYLNQSITIQFSFFDQSFRLSQNCKHFFHQQQLHLGVHRYGTDVGVFQRLAISSWTQTGNHFSSFNHQWTHV